MLAIIAAEMRHYALAHPRGADQPIQRYQRRLSGGLVVTLFYRGGWLLSLAREGVDPGAKEIAICKHHFNVPPYARVERRRNGDWHIARFYWRGVKQEKLL